MRPTEIGVRPYPECRELLECRDRVMQTIGRSSGRGESIRLHGKRYILVTTHDVVQQGASPAAA